MPASRAGSRRPAPRALERYRYVALGQTQAGACHSYALLAAVVDQVASRRETRSYDRRTYRRGSGPRHGSRRACPPGALPLRAGLRTCARTRACRCGARSGSRSGPAETFRSWGHASSGKPARGRRREPPRRSRSGGHRPGRGVDRPGAQGKLATPVSAVALSALTASPTGRFLPKLLTILPPLDGDRSRLQSRWPLQ